VVEVHKTSCILLSIKEYIELDYCLRNVELCTKLSIIYYVFHHNLHLYVSALHVGVK